MNEYIQCIKKYAQFTGRARRKEYWMFALFNAIMFTIANVIDDAIGCVIVRPLYDLFIFVPSLSVNIRRLHDTDRSGWMLLLPSIPLVGLIILYSLLIFVPELSVIRRLHDTGWMLLLLFISLVGLIILLVFLCQDSKPGENRFGPNPKGM